MRVHIVKKPELYSPKRDRHSVLKQGQPLMWETLIPCTYDSSPKEEVVLVQVQLPRSLQYLGTHLEGEEQLVPLKQAPACVLVHCKRVVIIEVLDPLFETRMLQALIDGVGEELYVCVEGELVHGVDPAHVVHYKEEDGCTS